MTFKKGDNVIVITGKHKGAKGAVARVLGDRVIVDGVNKVKRHMKPKKTNEKGSIVEREASMHASNVMYVDGSGKRLRATKVAKK